ncbi:MAG: hypothetical protein ACXW28_01250 [Thermoanaerobaculia bacterium]
MPTTDSADITSATINAPAAVATPMRAPSGISRMKSRRHTTSPTSGRTR